MRQVYFLCSLLRSHWGVYLTCYLYPASKWWHQVPHSMFLTCHHPGGWVTGSPNPWLGWHSEPRDSFSSPLAYQYHPYLRWSPFWFDTRVRIPELVRSLPDDHRLPCMVECDLQCEALCIYEASTPPNPFSPMKLVPRLLFRVNRLRPIDEDHKIMISVSASQSWPLEQCDAILNLFRFHVRCVLNRLMKGKREKIFLAKKKKWGVKK